MTITHVETYGMKSVGKRVDELGEAIERAYKRLDVATAANMKLSKHRLHILKRSIKLHIGEKYDR